MDRRWHGRILRERAISDEVLRRCDAAIGVDPSPASRDAEAPSAVSFRGRWPSLDAWRAADPVHEAHVGPVVLSLELAAVLDARLAGPVGHLAPSVGVARIVTGVRARAGPRGRVGGLRRGGGRGTGWKAGTSEHGSCVACPSTTSRDRVRRSAHRARDIDGDDEIRRLALVGRHGLRLEVDAEQADVGRWADGRGRQRQVDREGVVTLWSPVVVTDVVDEVLTPRRRSPQLTR